MPGQVGCCISCSSFLLLSGDESGDEKVTTASILRASWLRKSCLQEASLPLSSDHCWHLHCGLAVSTMHEACRSPQHTGMLPCMVCTTWLLFMT